MIERLAASLRRLEGAFALVILFAGHPDLLICARRGSPLAIGFGGGEMYLGSDSLALAPLTRRILYLNEGDWAVVTTEGAEVFDAAHKRVQRQIKETALTGALIGKGNHRHYMEKEIFEQPAVIGDTTNLAFRLSGVAAREGYPDVVVTEAVRNALGDRHDFDGPYTVRVKGRRAEVPIFGIQG